MNNPTVREVLEKVYSCEVESDSKDKERILAQAESALDALYKERSLGLLPEEDIKVLLEPNSYGEGRVDGFNSAIQEMREKPTPRKEN